MLRGDLASIVVGSLFLFTGLAACAVAAIARRPGVRIVLWLGLWSAAYGAMHLTQSTAVIATAPRLVRRAAPDANAALSYLIIIPALLSFLELSRGTLRVLVRAAAWLALAIAVVGIGGVIATRPDTIARLSNNLLAAAMLAVLLTIVATPPLAARYFVFRHRGVLAAGMAAFAVEALFSNVSGSLGIPHWQMLDHAGFAVLLASFGYVAVTLVFDNERRLLAVEHELAVARRIQTAILPDGPPDVRHLRISATYRPMTAVGGDFYDFIRVGDTRVGILVADVAGHGVPAALIASMINVALQSVASSADDPGAVLCGLNRVLFRQSRTHLVSAAYLWLDTEHWTARYAAAGHPPLLRWGDGTLRRLESNGCLIGMMEDGHYPVLTTTIERGDRFLLYTDGVTEVENARGEFFDEGRLEQVLRDCRSHAPAAVSNELLSEIDRWRPARMPQQDDITFVVVDVA